MGAADEVDELLKRSGAVLIRDHKHLVYRLPNGNKFTRAKTPSDRKAAHNDLSDLRRALGMKNAGGGEGERRERRPKTKPARRPLDLTRTPDLKGGLAEQLAASGLVDMAEAEKARRWSWRWKSAARIYRKVTARQAGEIEQLRGELTKPCPCWWCRLKARIRP
jgi:hypothetical protein